MDAGTLQAVYLDCDFGTCEIGALKLQQAARLGNIVDRRRIRARAVFMNGSVQRQSMAPCASRFCRNCLGNWYREEAAANGIELSKDEARERVYGMPYEEWKEKYQTEATPEQQAAFEARQKKKAAKG